VTDQVAGQIAVNANSPAGTQIGVIQINARTLSTDSDMRNRAIKNSILDTNDYEYVTFTPVELVGLPDAVTIGEPFTFQIVGDLTVRDVTQQVTFAVELTPVSERELNGSASTTIRYADFGIAIPQVPSVTGVEEEVTLEIDFVAQSA
jgi:polyisoprenoid-binding protein YceI